MANYITIEELQEHLGVGRSWIQRRLDEIPHKRIGRKILRFEIEKVEAWMDTYSVNEGDK